MAYSQYDRKVKPKFVLIEAWARNGLTDAQISKNLGISKTTFYKYLKEHIELSELLKRNKEVVDVQVENALLKRALGYKYTEKKTEESENGIKVTETTKEVIPDTTAQIFWLKNRKPEQWRDKRTIESDNGLDKLDEILNNIKENAEKGVE